MIGQLELGVPGRVVPDEPGQVRRRRHLRREVAEPGARRRRRHRAGALSQRDERAPGNSQPGTTFVAVEQPEADVPRVVRHAAVEVGDGQFDGAQNHALRHFVPLPEANTRSNGRVRRETTPIVRKNRTIFRGGPSTNMVSRPFCDAAADLAARGNIVFS